ncbi:MAG: tetratricopeptide repeat protein [Deltaproteobacteria bacterium]|nr:tetratricopeptide repeat protein [Deltaproteobacteria bacterium]
MVGETRDHEFEPIEAEARQLLGEIELISGRPEQALTELRAVQRRAEARGLLPLLVESRLYLARAALKLEAPGRLPFIWLEDADAALQMMGRPRALEIEYLFTRSQVFEAEGEGRDLAAAEAAATSALSLADAEDSALHGRLSERLANVVALRGDHERAIGIYTQVADAHRARLGADHFRVGVALFNIALSERDLGRIPEAIGHIEQAWAIQSTALGPDSPRLAEIFLTLAACELDRGRARIAAAHLEHTASLRLSPAQHKELSVLRAAIAVELGDYETAWRIYMSPAVSVIPADIVAVNRAWLRCRLWACAGIDERELLRLTSDGPLADLVTAILANRDLEAGNPELARARLQSLAPADSMAEITTELDAEIAWLTAWAELELGRADGATLARAREAKRFYAAAGSRLDIVRQMETLEIEDE